MILYLSKSGYGFSDNNIMLAVCLWDVNTFIRLNKFKSNFSSFFCFSFNVNGYFPIEYYSGDNKNLDICYPWLIIPTQPVKLI